MAKKKKQEVINSKCPKCNGTGEFKRKKINGKKKGNRAELNICKILTEKIGMGKFNRVPSSGSFGSTHTLSPEASLCLAGDIIAPSPHFVFSIENKCGYNDIEIGKIVGIKPQLKQIGGFLEQSCADAVRIERVPMVIYTKDHRDPVAIIPMDNNARSNEVKVFQNEFASSIVFNHKSEKYPQWSRWVIFTLEELLDKAPKEFFFEENC